jgi:alpha-glucosidase (family GH31 glycosyl hydrolase)
VTDVFSHRPFGSGHPYRHDLDQRVPVHPTVGEPFEVRVMTSASVDSVVVRVEPGAGAAFDVLAELVDPASLVRDIGPFPARRTEEGHLAAAAEGTGLGDDVRVWLATVTLDAPARYTVVVRSDGAERVGAAHEVDPVTWRTISDLAVEVDGDAADRLEPGSVEWSTGAGGPVRVRFALRLDPGQHVIGLGERYATVDHRGEVLDCVVFEQYKHQGRRTYLPVPMAAVVGGDHWGFHVDTTRRTWFDLGATHADRIVVEAEVDPGDPVLRVALWRGEPATVVQRFLDRTGRPALPPAWVYEPWMSANEWNTQARVEAEVARSLAEDVPVGVVVIEAWSDESTFVAFRDAQYEVHPDGAPHRLADFTFPADGAWPDPVGMVRRLHDAGVRVLLWQIPLIPTDRGDEGQIAADVDALERLDLCVREADGSAYRNRGWWFPGALLPDFTNPDARRWWAERRRYLLEEVGVDGFKTDGGEHLWGHDLVYADGTTGAESNNRFPVLFAQTYHELFRETGHEAITFSRAGFTGSAAFPCHWAGDDDSTWDGIPAAIRAGLSAGIAGIWFWTWDLAGFSGPIPDAELYVRAAAVAAFCPIMQYHAEYDHHRVPSNDRTPWNIAERTGDQRALDVYRRFAHLRHRLAPYVAEQAERSLATGKPLMRPLCFDHPDDEAVWAHPLQFQLGDDLLVAPITEPGRTSVEVYLPAGEWIDGFTGEVHTGPVTLTRDVPWDEAAVYRRAGGSARLDGVLA